MTLAAPISLVDQQHIVLDDVSWDFYERLLKEVGDRPIRITYDSGSVEIMAPLSIHERWKWLVGQLIEMMCFERGIRIAAGGSTTFKRRAKKKGLEPDECYYVQQVNAVLTVSDLRSSKDPSPDLAIEIDITRRSIDREPIYAALGVPELWRFDGNRLHVLHLGKTGRYSERKSSQAFPFLPMDRFNLFLQRFESEDPHLVLSEFRDWVVRLP
jgi:Uma2 family endonuclease